MNLQSKMPTTADEFLRWNEGREGKRGARLRSRHAVPSWLSPLDWSCPP